MFLLENINFIAFCFLFCAQPALATNNDPGDVADLFCDVVMNTDGEVASVNFDYS